MSVGDTTTVRQRAHRSVLTAALGDLRALLGERMSTGDSVLAQYGRDESWHRPQLPDAVVFPETTKDVSDICAICYRHEVPIIPYGVGSSVEGALIPVSGGVVVSLGRMNQVLSVDPGNFDCTVQPGLQRRALNEYLRDTGLTFTVDPGADASIGGMVATRASGTNAVRYGTMADVVRAMEVVLVDGTVIRTGTRAAKSAAGYDLGHLFIGSEGTLGIVTEITVRLFPIPETVVAMTCCFETLKQAVDASVEVMQASLPVARIELLDDLMIDAVNSYSKTAMPVVPHLFFELHGDPESVRRNAEAVEEMVKAAGGFSIEWSENREEQNRLWRARHDCAYACMAYRRPRKMLTTDVCVPIPALTDCILSASEDAKANDIVAPVLGHVGDGNFHMVLLIDPDDVDEIRRAEGVSRRLVERAIAAGGTCTGEHGVGLGKRDYLVLEHGSAAVETMRAIKRALDPKGLMNPGKILPESQIDTA
ncbi:FAD-binding oxidoreductase [Amorphus sp. 3PC139-8]|uniref:FAD-binding oxidoreductase n=1 Tax=Amorphus sp. 3PC139-8 TaxID=2735676 RepID=UPI00345DD8DD